MGGVIMKKIVKILGILFVTVLIVIFIIYWIVWGGVVFNRVIIWTKPNVEIKYCADDRPYAKVKITEQEIQYDVVFYNVKYRTFILGSTTILVGKDLTPHEKIR
jgi:hypothetical protein